MKSGRRWLIGIVAAWIVVVGVLAVWSVGHERATVPEQRDLGLAVTDLQRAAGVVYTAAGGDGRALVLGALEFSPPCRITPVRSGLAASRTVTVYVADGPAGEALDAVAARLPDDYQADVGRSHGGTKLSLHADAGDFIGIDMSGESAATAFTLRLTTGCRPVDGDAPSGDDVSAPAAPARLSTVVRALGGQVGAPEASAVRCPSGGVAGSWTATGVPAPEDVPVKIKDVEVTPLDDNTWAYGGDDGSVIVLADDDEHLGVTVSTACQ